jgi:type VI secretion system protein ImpM
VNGKTIDPPGWYGKIASLGDFASRRLPPGFIAVWDAWLQQVISVSRSQLGDSWLDAYLTCPVWRFLLQPGVYGESLWAGVLMPSVDRVGRYFPLTVVSELSALPTTERELRSLCLWLEQIETLALSTLDTTCSPQRFDDQILATPLPWEPVVPSRISLARRLLATLHNEEMALLELPSADALPEALADVGGLLSGDVSRGVSLWWAQGTSGSSAPLLVCHGLPDTRRFAVMLRPAPPQNL